MQVNTNLQQMKGGYLFTEIINRTKAYQTVHPEAHILRLGVGDITRPLPAPIVQAMHQAVEEMGNADTFHGYGLENGYLWLRQTIIENDYTPRGVVLEPEEVFISDGAGSDLGNLSELFDTHNTVAIPEPAYPAYEDTSFIDRWSSCRVRKSGTLCRNCRRTMRISSICAIPITR